jgi:hypothetical protein
VAAGVSLNSQANAVIALLTARLATTRCNVVMKHYSEMAEELQKSHWESATVKAGKFVEAVLKCLWEHCGQTVPPDKEFKVDNIINKLPQVAPAGMHDSVKLTIPRACRFIYEVSSNRGARHDSSELDPNVMDANGVSAMASWILAELIRYSQQGAVTAPQAADLVIKLTEKKYPLFEEVDGRLYFSDPSLGARKLGLLLLSYRYPERLSREQLVSSIVRHGYSKDTSRKGVDALKVCIDVDDRGDLRLRAPGLEEAERLLSTLGSKR